MLASGFLKCAQQDLDGWFGITVDTLTLNSVLENFDLNYFQEETIIVDYNSENFSGVGLDTCVRYMVLDAVTDYFIGRQWPINGDPDEYKETFVIDFKNSIAKNDKWKWKN